MSDNWKLGIAGLMFIIGGFLGVILITDVDIDWRVALEIAGILFFLALIVVGAKMCLLALEEH